MPRTLVTIAAVLAVLTLAPTAAWAHTGLSSSTPPSGASVDGPLSKITLRFNEPIRLAGSGVEILDTSGAAIDARVAVDGAAVTARPDAPLDAGRFGVRWAVRAGDAHPVRGSFTFTVDGRSGSNPGTTASVGASEPPGAAADPAPSTPPASTTDDQALDAALASDPVAGIRRVDQALRAVFYALALGAVGVLSFLVGAWEGPRREARRLTRLTARLAAATAVVVVAQLVVRSARTAGGWSGAFTQLPSTATGSYAAGVGLRFAGALLLVAGVVALRRSLCAEVMPISGGSVDVHTGELHDPAVRLRPWSAMRRIRSAPAAVAGAVAILASFVFAGHAATAEPRGVALAAVLAHVAAAAMWGAASLASSSPSWPDATRVPSCGRDLSSSASRSSPPLAWRWPPSPGSRWRSCGSTLRQACGPPPMD